MLWFGVGAFVVVSLLFCVIPPYDVDWEKLDDQEREFLLSELF